MAVVPLVAAGLLCGCATRTVRAGDVEITSPRAEQTVGPEFKITWRSERVRTFGFKFRLPYLPVFDAQKPEAGQTVEAGVFTWDGNGSRLDHGVAFQWLVNPWLPNVGEIRCWNAKDGGSWLAAGLILKPDTEWHEVRLTVDMRRKTTAISIDGRVVSSAFTALPKPAVWGRTTDARAQIEAISVFPGEKVALHRVEVRDWFWDWEME